MTGRPLTPDEIAKLTSLPPRQRSAGTGVTVPGTSRSVKVNLDDRSWPMWWKIPTHSGVCNVPKHDERESPRKHMVVTIGDLEVCRRCYINKLDK
jgi:hypothetical protein